MSNQKYNFDYSSYCALNPMPGRRRRRSAASPADALPLEDVSRVGFGCYRASAAIPEHGRALAKALSLGCSLIDTASNYMDGRSEELVSEICRERSGSTPFVITKLGYISPAAEQFILDQGVRSAKLLPISPESKYSLADDSLRAQLALSRQRLQKNCIDAVLLHNPEYYFERDSAGDKDSRRLTLRKAFELLQGCVAEGTLRYYGVSSNSLVQNWPETLSEYLQAAGEASSTHHFRILEFHSTFLRRRRQSRRKTTTA